MIWKFLKWWFGFYPAPVTQWEEKERLVATWEVTWTSKGNRDGKKDQGAGVIFFFEKGDQRRVELHKRGWSYDISVEDKEPTLRLWGPDIELWKHTGRLPEDAKVEPNHLTATTHVWHVPEKK
jgi:hypothetical protein